MLTDHHDYKIQRSEQYMIKYPVYSIRHRCKTDDNHCGFPTTPYVFINFFFVELPKGTHKKKTVVGFNPSEKCCLSLGDVSGPPAANSVRTTLWRIMAHRKSQSLPRLWSGNKRHQ